MTLPYGVTLWAASDYVSRWYFDTWGVDGTGPFGDSPGKPCRYLAGKILDAVHGRCHGAVMAMDWLQSVAEACEERGVAFRWTAPSGWPVMQEYRKPQRRRIRAMLGGRIRRLSLRKHIGPIDKRRQRQGAAPNFVHSADAAVMAHAVSTWPGPPLSAIHDSFAVHAPYVPQLLQHLRDTVADVILGKDILSDTKREVESYLGVVLPDPPRLGTIDPGEVRESKNLFS